MSLLGDLVVLAYLKVMRAASRAIDSGVDLVFVGQAAFVTVHPEQHLNHLLPGVALIASGEARFDHRNLTGKEVIPKRASNLITLPNHNPTLLHPAETQTFNSLAHLNSPPLKKTLNLICPSYWRGEGQIRLIDAPQPLRRPQTKHCFKGHDKALSREDIMTRLGVAFVMCHRMI